MQKKNQKLMYFILWIVLCAVVVGVSITKNTSELEQTSIQVPSVTVTETEVEDEFMVGVWISYISLNSTEENFKDNFDELVQDAVSIGATDLFVHVRAFSDALYDSDYFPWSHLIGGTQGVEPSFDPLEYMIEVTHANDMNFHAWINPLRVSLSSTPSELSSDNPYNLYSETNPYYFIEIDGTITINPAYSEMRSLIANGVKEIVENYDVDGIHFDDYFYPETITDEDSTAYSSYCENTENPLSLEDWRMANINTLISLVYREIKSVDENVVFGISPQGNLDNNEALGADIETWCSTKGYIDYICPQIYFSYDNPYLGFTECLQEWTELEKYDGLKMYIGLALYKAGTDSDEGTWLYDDDIIKRQYEDSIEAQTDGIVLYDVRSITREEALSEIENFLN